MTLHMTDAEFFALTGGERGETNIYRKPTKKDNPEARIQRSIIDWLEAHGAIVIRTNSGMIMTAAGNRVMLGAPGTSDLTVNWHGRFVAIEVKVPKKKPTAAQQNYLDRVNASGGLGFVAHGLDDVIERLESL